MFLNGKLRTWGLGHYKYQPPSTSVWTKNLFTSAGSSNYFLNGRSYWNADAPYFRLCVKTTCFEPFFYLTSPFLFFTFTWSLSSHIWNLYSTSNPTHCDTTWHPAQLMSNCILSQNAEFGDLSSHVNAQYSPLLFSMTVWCDVKIGLEGVLRPSS